jgi:hypothetical protein
MPSAYDYKGRIVKRGDWIKIFSSEGNQWIGPFYVIDFEPRYVPESDLSVLDIIVEDDGPEPDVAFPSRKVSKVTSHAKEPEESSPGDGLLTAGNREMKRYISNVEMEPSAYNIKALICALESNVPATKHELQLAADAALYVNTKG